MFILFLLLLDTLAGPAALGWPVAVLCWDVGWVGVAGLLPVAPGCSWLPLAALGCCGCPWLFLAGPFRSWLLRGCSLAASSPPWLLPVLLGWFLAVPRLLPGCFLVFLTAPWPPWLPGCSWLSLAGMSVPLSRPRGKDKLTCARGFWLRPCPRCLMFKLPCVYN